MSITVLTVTSEPPLRSNVFTGGHRRSFMAAEKAAVIAENYLEEDSVCSIARRHGLSSSQLSTCRRLAQPRPSHEAMEALLFMPVLVSTEPEAPVSPKPSAIPKPRKRQRWIMSELME